jgi:hypothetical protein
MQRAFIPASRFAKMAQTDWHSIREGDSMRWVKPEFEFVDLCSEVTSYLHYR